MSVDDDQDEPTPKESGSFAIFESTCEEAITRLSGRDTEEADALRHEARELLTLLRAWKSAAPHGVQRSSIASRVVALHRASLELASASMLR